MKKIIFILFIAILFIGCEEKKFDGINMSSLEVMIYGLPEREKKHFLSDFKIATYFLGGKHKLRGYTFNEIKERVIAVKKMILQKNKKFLESKISQMKNSKRKSVYIHINHGLILEPQIGYIYDIPYTIQEFENILYKFNGNINKYHQKAKFIKYCNKKIGNSSCKCLWDNLNTKYSFDELINNIEHPENYQEQSVKKCIETTNKKQEYEIY